MQEPRICIEATMLKAAEDAPTKIEIRDITPKATGPNLIKTLDSVYRFDADWMPVVAYLLNKYPGRAVKAGGRTGLNGHLGKNVDGTRTRLYEIV
jgi:hypothetical protein